MITVLFDRGLAVFTSFLFSIIVGMITDGQFSFALVAFAGCMAGIFGIGAFATRSDLLRGGLFYISLANMGMILILGLLNETAPGLVLAGMGMGLLNGITSSILALGLLPYLESAFITSTVPPLELSNLTNHCSSACCCFGHITTVFLWAIWQRLLQGGCQTHVGACGFLLS